MNSIKIEIKFLIQFLKLFKKLKILMMIKLTISQAFLILKDGEIDEFDYLPTTPWKQKELLYEEFKSLGFYISDHPLSEYNEVFNQLNIISFNQFVENDKNEGLVAGTIMSLQEKKVQKALHMQLLNLVIKQENSNYFYFQKYLL